MTVFIILDCIPDVDGACSISKTASQNLHACFRIINNTHLSKLCFFTIAASVSPLSFEGALSNPAHTQLSRFRQPQARATQRNTRAPQNTSRISEISGIPARRKASTILALTFDDTIPTTVRILEDFFNVYQRTCMHTPTVSNAYFFLANKTHKHVPIVAHMPSETDVLGDLSESLFHSP